MPIRRQCPFCATPTLPEEAALQKSITCAHCGQAFDAEAPPEASDRPIIIAEQSAHSTCRTCGAFGPTAKVSFNQNIGAVAMRFHRRIHGNLCRRCIDKYFYEYTFTTLLLGWWGVISFFTTPVYLISNIRSYIGTRKFRGTKESPTSSQPTKPLRPLEINPKSRHKVVTPAILLIVMASLGLLFDVFGVAVNLYPVNNPPPAKQVEPPGDPTPPDDVETPQEKRERHTHMIIVWSVQGVVCLIILAGAIRMLRLKSWRLALAGSILAAIPLLSPCLCLTPPFALWSLLVLCMSDVRREFT